MQGGKNSRSLYVRVGGLVAVGGGCTAALVALGFVVAVGVAAPGVVAGCCRRAPFESALLVVIVVGIAVLDTIGGTSGGIMNGGKKGG